MRIAQVAPLYESVPPKWYGGTERVVSYLTEALVEQGHDVTLFASGDSCTQARLVPVCPRSLRLDKDCTDPYSHHVRLLELVRQHADEFEVIHFHTDYLHYPISLGLRWRTVTTLHGRLDSPDLVPLYHTFREIPVVSISDAQRLPLPHANWRGTVYHGLPPDLHTYCGRPGKYLAFLGRISPEKGVDRAIAIARQAGLPLRIAAKIDRADREYFETEIKHLLDDPLVEYIGEVGGREKDEFLGNAASLLFPINWPEPFGLAMIEAMASGTPVIAWPGGSVPEVVDEGISGFIVSSVNEAVHALDRALGLDRAKVRAVFEKRFSASRMARDYVQIYEGLIVPKSFRLRIAAHVNGNGAFPVDHDALAPNTAQSPLIGMDYPG